MTGLVVDASALGRAILPDERNELTGPLLSLLADHELIQPSHWPIELAGLIVRASRRRRVSSIERHEAIALAVGYMENATVERQHSVSSAIDLALRQHISVYDAAYLEIAIRNELPLLTNDAALRLAASALGVSLVDPT